VMNFNRDEAIKSFDNLVNSFEAQVYASQGDYREILAQLGRTRELVQKVFGPNSSYLKRLKPVKFEYPRAKQKNAPIYFNNDKQTVLEVLNTIIDELKVNSPLSNDLTANMTFVPSEILESLARFRQDHPTQDKTGVVKGMEMK